MKSDSEVLRERAGQLAKPLSEGSDPHSLYEVLEFSLGHGKYCIETSSLVDVHPLEAVMPLPGTPGFVLGLMAIRGRIVCVLDLKRWLELPVQGLGDHPKVILLRGDAMEFGIAADVVGGIVRIGREDILPLPPGLASLALVTKGISKDHGVLLDAKALLTDPRITVHQGDFS